MIYISCFFVAAIFLSLGWNIRDVAAQEQGMATSAKMIKLQMVKPSDLVLCSTGKFDEIAKEIAKQNGVEAPMVVIEIAVLVEKNTDESLTGSILENVKGELLVAHGIIKHQEFKKCKQVVVVDLGSKVAELISIILNEGLPLVITPSKVPVLPEPSPPPPAPTVPTSRKQYL